MVQIPKSSVLSRRTCRFAGAINTAFEEQHPDLDEPNLWLSLVLLTELSQGTDSKWHGYLQSLPLSPVPLASFWLDGEDDIETERDSKLASAWIRGTAVERLIQRENVLPKLREFYISIVATTLQKLGLAPNPPISFKRFCYAYSLVSSRAFHIDAYHGIAMVPIADAFNHVEENQVHFESDYHVCPACGSFDQCEHDEQDDQPSRASNLSIARSSTEDDTCEMVANSLIHPDTEVFNTYDSSAPNSKLLVHYGFMLEANSNDMIFFEIAELGEWLERLNEIPMEALHDDEGLLRGLGASDLFFEIEQDENSKSGGNNNGGRFAINAEGVMSEGLFTLLVLRNMWKTQQDGERRWPASDFFDWLRHSSRLLFILLTSIISALSAAEDDEDDGPPPTPIDDSSFTQDTYTVALGICSDVDHLCIQKLKQLGPVDVGWGADWGEILDATPPTSTKARMAITHAMNERNILVACRETWREIGELVAGWSSLMDTE